MAASQKGLISMELVSLGAFRKPQFILSCKPIRKQQLANTRFLSTKLALPVAEKSDLFSVLPKLLPGEYRKLFPRIKGSAS
jgi:hypothetical protein